MTALPQVRSTKTTGATPFLQILVSIAKDEYENDEFILRIANGTQQW